MRIGIDARFYGGEQSKGLGRYTQKLIQYAAEHDTENEYVIFLQQDGMERWSITNPRFHPVLAPYRWYTIAEQLFLPLQIWKARVDFMHFPHFNVPLLYRTPFIVTIHDLIILRFPTERATTLGPLLYKVKHWAGQMVMRHAVQRSAHILTVSHFSKKDIVEYYGVDPKQVTVTHEAAELPNEPSVGNDHCTEQILRSYRIHKPYFLYVGNAYPHKNLEIILHAIKEKKRQGEPIPWQFVFVGRDDYFFHRLKQMAWSMDIDDSTLFTGFVPDSDLPYLYRNAVAYVFPSLYEGFGLPPLEAMSYGTPVLAARSSCLPEILGDAAVYFDPADISGILQAISSISADEQLRHTLAQKGLEQVKQYSWKRMMEQTLAEYRNHASSKQKETAHPD